jgi:hypothetical protein
LDIDLGEVLEDEFLERLPASGQHWRDALGPIL